VRSSKGLVAQKFAHPFLEERDGVHMGVPAQWVAHSGHGAPEKIDSQVLFDVLLDELEGPEHDAVRGRFQRPGPSQLTSTVVLQLKLHAFDGRSLHLIAISRTNGGYYTLTWTTWRDRHRLF